MTSPSSFIVTLRRARKALSQSHFSEAQRCYLSLLEVGVEREGVLTEMYQLYLKSGKRGEAVRCLESLVKVNPTSVDYVVRLASEYEFSGLREESVQAYRQALSINPELPNCLFNMALQLRKLGRLSESAEAYEEALQRGISDRDEVYNNLALVYSEMNQSGLASACFEKALAINSNYIPALFNRAGMEEELGNKERAKSLYHRVLALDESYYPALSRLLYIDELKYPDDPLIKQAEAALQARAAPSLECEELWFALGKAQDDCGEYDSAFQSYTSANRIGSARFSRYQKEQQEKLVSDIMETFDDFWFSRVPKISGLSPIFICGMLRSGSTLLEKVLSGHSRIIAGGELAYIPDFVRNLGDTYPSGLKDSSFEFFEEAVQGYERFVRERLGSPELFTDKRPDNFLHIGLIKSLFPDAKIVWSKRNLLDNCLSIYFQQLGAGMNYSVSLDWIGHFYRQHLRLMEHWKYLFPDSICEVEYESVVNSPRKEIQRMLKFIALDWEESCLDLTRDEGAVKTASVWQVRKPIYRNSSGRYKNYERSLAPLRKYL